MHFVESAFTRGITSFVLNYVGAKYFLKNELLFDNYKSTNYFLFMNTRSLCLGIYALTMPSMVFYLPMPAIHTIAASATVIVSILDYYIYSVKINRIGVVGIVIGLFGVLIMANDSIIIGYFDPSFEFTS